MREGVRDPATLVAVLGLGAGTLALHATTQFALGAEHVLRAEMARDSMLLVGAAVAALACWRVGGVEWREGVAQPIVAAPGGRLAWFAGRWLGSVGLAALAVGAVALAAAVVAPASAVWPAALGAIGATVALVTVALSASLALTPGGAMGCVAACHVAGHLSTGVGAAAGLSRGVWRVVVPDLAAVAGGGAALAILAAGCWTAGVWGLGACAAEAREA